MSFRKDRRGQRNQPRDKENAAPVECDSDNPVIQEFQKYAVELNEKHDRAERLVKCSRDITIEAKRIIFLLHNIDARWAISCIWTSFGIQFPNHFRKNNRDSILQEAELRIEKLFSCNFKNIAIELKGLEVYQFLRSISAGIQEFIEAFTFLEYLLKDELVSDWDSIQSRLSYKSEGEIAEDFSFSVDPAEFVLGLADLTGEVMRNCINSLGSADTDKCFKSCQFLQGIYAKYLRLKPLHSRSRDFSQKMTTMRASTLKCEHVCYSLKVRGTEGSNMLSFETVPGEGADVDEGFYWDSKRQWINIMSSSKFPSFHFHWPEQ